MPALRKRAQCKDGFSMSVQASYGHYCSPRVDDLDLDQYTHVEVGYPSEKEELLMEYAEDEDDPTGTVYVQVPIELVVEIIQKHGGIA